MPTQDPPLSMTDARRPPLLLLWLVVLAAVFPNIVWAFADRTAWPWDEAWYGKTSVDLFYTLVYSPSEWIPAMMGALGRAAPGIAWVGQFFVPIGRMARSIDAGLLLSVVSAQAIALYLVARALWDLSGGSRGIACTGLLVMAAAPLFIGLSHHYVVEMQQAVAVAWFMLIMVRAPHWSPLLTISQLLLATATAMLAKVSSPLFCFGPGLASVYYVVRYTGRSGSEPIGRSIATLAISVPLVVATIAWYERNIQFVVEHVSLASTGRVAELYGKADAFLPSFTFWTTAFGKNFFTTLTIAVAAIVLAAAVVALFNDRRRTQHRLFGAAAIVAAVQILVTLAVFSLSSNRDDRYLLPLVPYAAMLVSWALAQLNRNAITLVVMSCFAVQWGYAHAQALGLVRRGTAVQWLHPVMRDPSGRALVDAVVDRTCTDAESGFHWNAIGVQLLWLNAPGVSYAASKKLAPAHRLTCDYDAIDYYDGDERAAWTRLLGRKLVYYVSLDASAYEIPPDPVYTTINALNQPILKRIETSGQFQLEPALVRRPRTADVFKSVADRVDHLSLRDDRSRIVELMRWRSRN